MGKVEENKIQKLNALLRSSYDLFITKGIAQTSIHDIVQKAGVAKGTFYLYFKDKYEIRDRLIVKTAEKLFKKRISCDTGGRISGRGRSAAF